jgi:hypothetical protein
MRGMQGCARCQLPFCSGNAGVFNQRELCAVIPGWQEFDFEREENNTHLETDVFQLV